MLSQGRSADFLKLMRSPLSAISMTGNEEGYFSQIP